MKNEIKQNEQIDEIKNMLLAYQPLIDIQYDAFGVIAEALVKSGFSNNSDHIAEREMLSSENKELENALKQSEDNYSRAFERLKAQQREIERLKAENDSLNKKISELEQDLIHADENVFYRECDVKLVEDKIKKQAQIDVLNKLKKKTHNYYSSIDSYCISQHVVLVRDIDGLIAEVENDK